MTDGFIDLFVQVSNIVIGAQPSWANQTHDQYFYQMICPQLHPRLLPNIRENKAIPSKIKLKSI